MHHPTERIIHTTAFVTLVVEHWLEREILGKEDCNSYKRTYTQTGLPLVTSDYRHGHPALAA